MIYYKHPIIVEMKQVYREGCETQDLIYSIYNNEGPGWIERRKESVDIARKNLDEALTQIPELMNKMKVAKDLPEDEKSYYLDFMNQHLKNIQTWIEKLPN